MEILLGLHNFTRWLVLLAGVAAVVLAVGGGAYGPAHRAAGQAFIHSFTLQLLLGLVLLFFSPFMQGLWADPGAAMAQRETRFFVAEHWVGMIIALALAHIGSARVRRAPTDGTRHRQTLVFFGLSLLITLLSIPWWRPLLPGV